MCGDDKNVVYHNIEGISDTIRAETCNGCSAYVKIFHQDKDPDLDPVADDVASLGLDLLLRAEGYPPRFGQPVLAGLLIVPATPVKCRNVQGSKSAPISRRSPGEQNRTGGG